MKTAKLFQNGQSQAVRLPKAFRFKGTSVFIQQVGGCVVLVPRDDPWQAMFDAAQRFTDDFMAERDQGLLPKREMIGNARFRCISNATAPPSVRSIC